MDPDILHPNPRRRRPFSLLSPFPMSPVTPITGDVFLKPVEDLHNDSNDIGLVVGRGFDGQIAVPDDFELDRVGRFHRRQNGLGDQLVAGEWLAG